MTTSPQHCKINFDSAPKSTIEGTVQETNRTKTVVIFAFNVLTDGPRLIATQDGQEIAATLREVREDKQASAFTAQVRLDCIGRQIDQMFKAGDTVKVADTVSASGTPTTEMRVQETQNDQLYLIYRWPLATINAKASFKAGLLTKKVVLNDFAITRDANGQCSFEMTLGPVPGLRQRIADGFETLFFRLAAWWAKKPNGKKANWPKRIAALLTLTAIAVAIWSLGPEAYHWLTGVAGGLLAPSAPAASQSAAPPEDPNAYGCVPANDWTVHNFFWQEDSKRVLGKIAPYKPGTLGFSCKAPAPYDEKSKTSDVSGCEICMPMKYSKAGKYPLTADFLQRMFGQSDPTCYFEPALPFRPSQKTLNETLRIDMECKDYSFNPAGCFDYSKCLGIVPQYYTDK